MGWQRLMWGMVRGKGGMGWTTRNDVWSHLPAHLQVGVLQRVKCKSVLSNGFAMNSLGSKMYSQNLEHNHLSTKGVLIDVDGVLMRGKVPISGATQALQKLIDHKIPFLLCSNSGGETEKKKVERWNRALQLKLHESQIVISHTPMKDLVPLHGKETVLLLGTRGAKEAAIQYGFEDIITTQELAEYYPKIFPFRKYSSPKHPRQIQRIGAVMVFNDPVDWAQDIQILCDVLSSNGELTPEGPIIPANEKKQIVPLYVSNPDLLWAGEYPLPRFGQGAFRYCLSALFEKRTGKKLEFTEYGKPTPRQFDYAKNAMLALCQQQNQPLVQSFFMIGDNPAADCVGAVSAGFHAVLVKTGVYDGKPTSDTGGAHNIVQDIQDAVDYILQI